MTALYELTNGYKRAFTELESLLDSGEIDEQSVKDTLIGVGGECKNKIFNVAKHVLNMKDDLLSISNEKKRLQIRSERIKKSISYYEKCIIDSMNEIGEKRIDYDIYNVITSISEPLIIDSIDLVPDDYKKSSTVVSIDKMLAKKHLKDGKDVQGVHLGTNINLLIK